MTKVMKEELMSRLEYRIDSKINIDGVNRRKLIPKREFMHFIGIKSTQMTKIEKRYSFQKVKIGKIVFYKSSTVLNAFKICTD